MKKNIIISVLLILVPLVLVFSFIYLKQRKSDKRHPRTTWYGKKPDPRICEHPHGIDLSHHNVAYDWSKVDAQFVYVRATMGSNIKDKRYSTHRKAATRHNIPVGAYHFLTAKTSAKAQFDNFQNTVSPAHIKLRPMLDIEESKYWNAPRRFTDEDAHRLIRDWCDLCKGKYGIAPIIYTTEKLYERYKLHRGFDDCIWWVANYNGIKNYQKMCKIPFTIHQYSDKKYVEGFYGYIDCNRFASGKSVSDLLVAH